MNDHDRALELFCASLYRIGSPVLFVKAAAMNVRIGTDYGCAKALRVLYDERQDWIEEFLKRLSSKPRYTELVQALGRVPTIEDIRFAFRPNKLWLSAVFLDEAKPQHMDQYGHVWIETSPDNWQAHFLLDNKISQNDAIEVQKLLIEKLGGDSSSVAGIQARRFPVPGLRAYVNDERPPYDTKALIEEAIAAKPEPEPIKSIWKPKGYLRYWSIEDAAKYWNIYLSDKNKANGDKSRADAMLMHRLFKDGVEPEDTKELVRQVSVDIESRKSGHVEDYLERTLQAVMSYHQ